jgi:cytidylate kinase
MWKRSKAGGREQRRWSATAQERGRANFMGKHITVTDQRLNLLRRHWRRQPGNSPASEPRSGVSQPFAVAVSRELGARGADVACEIGELLQWPVYDHEIIDLIAQESGLRSELLDSVDEHDRNWLVEAIASFKRRGEVSGAEFVHHLVHVLSALATHGNCVIVGRGAAACLPRASTLRVRVVADLGDRVHRVAKKRGLSEDAAMDQVERVDQQRGAFVANHFHRDILDAHNFDLVVNTSRLTPAACAELAVRALRAVERDARDAAAVDAAGQPALAK